MPHKKYSYAQQTCISKAGLALQQSKALWNNCRIGIAVSGGVDSFTLLKVMKIRLAITPFKFEIIALHLNPGFNQQNHAPLLPWLASQGIPGHIEITNFGSLAHSPANTKKSPCFLCAWNRRKRLFELCKQYKLTHIALGHNSDDLLSTFLLNFCRSSHIKSMNVSEDFFKGALRVIRPLLFVEKKYILQAARQWSLPVWNSECPSANTSARAQTTEIIEQIAKYIPNAPTSMRNALIRCQLNNNQHQSS